MPDEMRKLAEEAIAEARSFDGCEAVISLSDPATGESISVSLYRDQAAMDAVADITKAKIAQFEEMGSNVGAPRVYTAVIAEL
jgi:hypothetical protein